MQVTEIRLQKDSSGRSKGFGHIDFETRDMLISAIGLNELVSHQLFECSFCVCLCGYLGVWLGVCVLGGGGVNS